MHANKILDLRSSQRCSCGKPAVRGATLCKSCAEHLALMDRREDDLEVVFARR